MDSSTELTAVPAQDPDPTIEVADNVLENETPVIEDVTQTIEHKNGKKSFRVAVDDRIIAEDGQTDLEATPIAVAEQKPTKQKYTLKYALKNRFSIGEPVQVDTIKSQDDLETDTDGWASSDVGEEGTLALANKVFQKSKIYDEDADIVNQEVSQSAFEESDEDDWVKPNVDTVELKNFFLDKFEDMPSLSDLSEEEEEIILIRLPVESQSEKESSYYSVDKGNYVDPLTGEILKSTSSSTSSCDTEQVEQFVEEEEEQDQDIFYDDLLIEPEPVTEDIDNFETNFFIRFKDGLTDTVATENSYDVLRNEQELQKIIAAFVFQLINDVIENTTSIDPRKVIRRNLDKGKLITDLSSSIYDYMMEKQINAYLTTKVHEYYKRIKTMRSFARLSPKLESQEKMRYRAALIHLDILKKQAVETKKKNAYLMSSVLMDLMYVRNINMSTETDFETLVRTKLIRKDSEFLTRVVNRELRLMNNFRAEISDTRLSLITRKHTMARLQERIINFEHIKDDISMSTFISIQNEVQAMEKKIEERQGDLKRLRTSYHSELHCSAHNREKVHLIQQKLALCKTELKNMQEHEEDLRDQLYNLKVKRGQMRHKHNELIYQGGLLSTPMLMYDYDATIDKIKVKYSLVSKLRNELEQLLNRVAMAEKVGGPASSIEAQQGLRTALQSNESRRL